MAAPDLQGRTTRKLCITCNQEYLGEFAQCPNDGTVLIPLGQDPLLGKMLADRYLIQSIIGHGGMGVVYKARHELMDRIVAIKMLQSQLITDSQSVKRFQHEARAASRLNHPHVITLFDFGVSPTGQPYLVMDYLSGISMSDLIQKDGQVSVDRTLNILIQACQALDHAHKQGVVHRDLKPGNIMLIEHEGQKDFVKVVDFGVAKLSTFSGDEAQKLTQTGEVCGSPVYMSPEQCLGQKMDNRSDIYSLGVVLYEALTGHLPLLGKNMVETMSKHIGEKPPSFNTVRPDLYIPERLEAVVFRCLEKDPAARQQSMAELEHELEQSVPGRQNKVHGQTRTNIAKVQASSSISTPTIQGTPNKQSNSKTIALIIVSTGILLLISILAFFAMQTNFKPANLMPEPATTESDIKPVISPAMPQVVDQEGSKAKVQPIKERTVDAINRDEPKLQKREEEIGSSQKQTSKQTITTNSIQIQNKAKPETKIKSKPKSSNGVFDDLKNLRSNRYKNVVDN